LVGVLAGCSDTSASDNYGVTPWVGPPTTFTGFWRASAMHDQTGAAVDGGADISVVLSPPYGTTLPILGDFGGDPCLASLGGNDFATMTLTPDGHGFDGTVGTQLVPIHARVDAANQMHLELDTTGDRFISPTNVSYGTCTKTISGIAIHQ
jgi:hypothetical protein